MAIAGGHEGYLGVLAIFSFLTGCWCYGFLIYENPLSYIFMIHALFCMHAEKFSRHITKKYLNAVILVGPGRRKSGWLKFRKHCSKPQLGSTVMVFILQNHMMGLYNASCPGHTQTTYLQMLGPCHHY